MAYDAVFTGLVANAAHIHAGAVGVAGGIVYPLTLNTSGTGVKGSLTVTGTDVTNLEAGGYHINAHSAAHPSGEIRGQISKR